MKNIKINSKLAWTVLVVLVIGITILNFYLWKYFNNSPIDFTNRINTIRIEDRSSTSALPSQIQTNQNKNGIPEKESQSTTNQVQVEIEKTDQPIQIIDRFVQWGYKIPDSPRLIDTIVIHSSYNALGGYIYDVGKIIEEYKMYGVSPHYIISRNGTIYRLVPDKYIAYHAGKSQTPDKRTNVNNFSIGIEIVNSKTSTPTEKQYQSLAWLIKELKTKYKIKYILGHNQIDPERRTDPWNFDWHKLDSLVKG